MSRVTIPDVGRTPNVPRQLRNRPFSLEEARDAGLTLDALSGSSWRRLGTEIYCWSGLAVDPLMLIGAWHRRLPEAVFSGATAAWLLGIDLKPPHPIEVVVPPSSGVRSRPGLTVRRASVAAPDVVLLRGLPATSVCRTLSELCRRLPDVESLVAIDASLRLGIAHKSALQFGTRRLRALAGLAAPAESPMETRLRWLLLRAGLPRPDVQTDLRDADGRFIGRADLYYPSTRLVVEYDGINHRDRLVEDDRRQNQLINAGFTVLRFTAGDIYQRPDVVVLQVRRALTRS